MEKKNQYKLSPTKRDTEKNGPLVERHKRGDKLTMKERLAMYEKGLVDIEVPSDRKELPTSAESVETNDPGDNDEKNDNVSDDDKVSTVCSHREGKGR